MENPQEISIVTICHGGVPEVFDRELAEVLNNILDVNTDAEKARTMTLKFTFAPLQDRQGATVTFSCRAGLQPVQVAKSPIFLSRQSGAVKAYALDQRQVDLFMASAPTAPTLSVSK